LALATVLALQHHFRVKPLALSDAIQVGERGRRSAVGSYGFFRGGLIVDRGKFPDEPISDLDCHERIPDSWRFVVLCPRLQDGMHGERERQAFRSVPPVPLATTQRLNDEIHQQLLPAIRAANFGRFAQSVWRYGETAGSCFAAVQGGCFNGPIVTRLVELIRALGVEGVGQSSWGPGVFAVTPSQSAAEELVDQLETNPHAEHCQIWISPPRNSGHSVDVSNAASLHRPPA
jgi:beta-RFAP synthase